MRRHNTWGAHSFPPPGATMAASEEEPVPDLIIRPTMKFVYAGAVLAAIVFIGLEVAWFSTRGPDAPGWTAAVPALILLWPAARWVRRQCTKTTVSGDRLRYEVGLASRSTRTIQLSKIQDVRVDQGAIDRLWDVGNISIETAGETSRLTLTHVDSPQRLADEIMTRAQHGTPAI